MMNEQWITFYQFCELSWLEVKNYKILSLLESGLSWASVAESHNVSILVV